MGQFLLGVLFVQRTDGFFAQEKAVEDPVEAQLLFPGVGIDRAQSRFDHGAVVKPQLEQDAHRFLCLKGRYIQPFLAQDPPEKRQLFEIDFKINHGDDGDARGCAHSWRGRRCNWDRRTSLRPGAH